MGPWWYLRFVGTRLQRRGDVYYIIILYTYKILISVRAAPTYVAYELFILACAVSMLY